MVKQNRFAINHTEQNGSQFHVDASSDLPSDATAAPVARQDSILPDSTDVPFEEIQISKQQGVSLRIQLLRTILPVVLIPLLVASAIGYRIVQQRTEDRVQRQLEDQALLASEGTSSVLKDLLDIPKTIASNPLVVNEALAGGNQAETAGLDKVPTEELEKRFKDTKLVRTHQALNEFLEETAKTAEIAEVLITERHGFNVAYSGPATDFVQSDEEWWQKGKSEKQWVGPPDFDYAAKGFTVELVQSIQDLQSGRFLGVVRAVLPARKFSLVTKYVQRTGISGSQRVQLIDTAALSVIDTFSPQGFRQERHIIGDKAVGQVAAALAEAYRRQSDPMQAVSAVVNQYSIQNIKFDREEQTLTASFVYQGKQYELATIPQTSWVAIASMDLNEVSTAGHDLLLLFGLTAVLLGGITTGLILLLSRQLSRPIWNLASTAKQVAAGNLTVTAEPHGTMETQTLAQTFNKLVVQVRGLLQQQETETRKAQLFAEITGASAANLQELQSVFGQATEGIRQILEVDRVLIYRLKPNGSGYVAAESVAAELPHALDYSIEDISIPSEMLEAYRSGQVMSTRDFEQGFLADPLQSLADLKTKASLVVPILNENTLFGLLIAHQCRAGHDWQSSEAVCLQQLAAQLKLVVDRVTSLDQIQEARRTAEALSEEQRRQKEEQRRQKERLQQQVLALISEVEGVAQGDLTVRASVTDGEIGSVASFFNLTVESLQKLVTQVKQSTLQVTTFLEQNQEAVSQLANEMLQQMEGTTQTLDVVQQMTLSMEAVAESAYRAAEVAHSVSTIAATGETRMDLTTQKILNLQEMITKTAEKAESLSRSSEQISKVTSLIREIAMQISSLFDDTRPEIASSEGRQNFAVMAIKVGQLAARTTEATRPIESFLSTIQKETKQVVDAMALVTTQMSEGTQLVQESKQSLEQVLDVSHQTDQLVQSVSEVTVSQVQTSQSIFSIMQQIAQLSERTSNFSNQLSSALQQTVKVAQELQSSVSTFKVTTH